MPEVSTWQQIESLQTYLLNPVDVVHYCLIWCISDWRFEKIRGKYWHHEGITLWYWDQASLSFVCQLRPKPERQADFFLLYWLALINTLDSQNHRTLKNPVAPATAQYEEKTAALFFFWLLWPQTCCISLCFAMTFVFFYVWIRRDLARQSAALFYPWISRVIIIGWSCKSFSRISCQDLGRLFSFSTSVLLIL